MKRGRASSPIKATLAINEGGNHAQMVRDHLAEATRFICAVAFARMSGFNQIEEALHKRISSGMSATFVVGTDFFQTEPEVILALLNMRKLAKDPAKVQVYMGSNQAAYTFHPKIYVFTRRSDTTAIVGSANMTFGGLCENHEFSAVIRGTEVGSQMFLEKWIADRIKDKEIVEANKDRTEQYGNRGEQFTKPICSWHKGEH